jgi:hypothetical protein
LRELRSAICRNGSVSFLGQLSQSRDSAAFRKFISRHEWPIASHGSTGHSREPWRNSIISIRNEFSAPWNLHQREIGERWSGRGIRAHTKPIEGKAQAHRELTSEMRVVRLFRKTCAVISELNI